MKYVSLILILFAMKWTWAAAYCEEALPTYVHVDIQNDLQNYISEYIQENAPEAQNISFENIWTETVKKNKIKAHFSYSFNHEDDSAGPTTISLEGYAVLNRVIDPKEDVFDLWSFDELFILNDHIEFEQGVTIKAGHE